MKASDIGFVELKYSMASMASTSFPLAAAVDTIVMTPNFKLRHADALLN
jgi:hypothetical protein